MVNMFEADPNTKEAMEDANRENFLKFRKKIKGMTPEQAGEYILKVRKDGWAILFSTAYPEDVISLLGKTPKNALKNVFEYIKENPKVELFFLEKIRKDYGEDYGKALENHFGFLKRTSGVSFFEKPATKAESSDNLAAEIEEWDLEYKAREQKEYKETEIKVKEFLMQFGEDGYNVSSPILQKIISSNKDEKIPELRKIEETIFDLENLGQFIESAKDTTRYILKKLSPEQLAKIDIKSKYHKEDEFDGYKIIFERNGEISKEEETAKIVKNIQERESETVFQLFRDFLKNPNRYEEHLEELKKKNDIAKTKTG